MLPVTPPPLLPEPVQEPIKISQAFPLEKRHTITKPIRPPSNAVFSNASAPLWFFVASGVTLSSFMYFFANYEPVKGAYGRDFVPRRSAGVLGQDGFIGNIPVPGADPIRKPLSA